MTAMHDKTGHRDRLRKRFLDNPHSFGDYELLELLLTYAIPRRDVAPLAGRLIAHFGSLAAVFDASPEQLDAVTGVGAQTVLLIRLVSQLMFAAERLTPAAVDPTLQPYLFNVDEDIQLPGGAPVMAQENSSHQQMPNISTPEREKDANIAPAEVKTFANDEIANSLTFIPQAAQFKDIEAFKAHLTQRLPYNSASTRQRRANYILGRFFPADRLDVPLTYFAARCTGEQDLKPALFYHVLKAEPLAAKVAEEFIWPALPSGYVERDAMREFILRYLPDIGASSQKNVLRSVFNTYDLLSVGIKEESTLRFQVHSGTLEAFLYLVTAEFPEPGIYTFEALEESPLRRWLLWDREWMRRQLYNLRDFGIISKVSEIDTVRQFTLQFDQAAALTHYFDHPDRNTLVLRET